MHVLELRRQAFTAYWPSTVLVHAFYSLHQKCTLRFQKLE